MSALLKPGPARPRSVCPGKIPVLVVVARGSSEMTSLLLLFSCSLGLAVSRSPAVLFLEEF